MVRTEVHTYLASTFIYYPYVDALLYLPPMCGLPGWLSSNSLPAIHEPQETRVQFLGQEHPLEDGTATHASVCLENPVDRGAFWATVHGVLKSRAPLERL